MIHIPDLAIDEITSFGVRLRVKSIKMPTWYHDGAKYIRRSAIEPNHPESQQNWIRKNLGIEPEPWMIKSDLDDLIEQSKAIVEKMTQSELDEMIRKQGEGWARSEAQWAKDFREGKCKRD